MGGISIKVFCVTLFSPGEYKGFITISYLELNICWTTVYLNQMDDEISYIFININSKVIYFSLPS